MAEVREFMPGLWLVESQLEDFQVRGAVIAGGEKLLVWDTLARPADMKGIAELAPALPLVVVYSHADWDHVLGTSGLTRMPVEIIGHRLALERFSQELPGELEERRAEDPQGFEEAVLVSPTRTVADRLPDREGSTIDIGGLEIELHPLPGHTSDSIVCFIPEWGVLLGGDSVETPLPFLNAGSPLRTWSEALTGWAERLEASPNPAIVIPSHGRVGGPELLRENALYLDSLLAHKEPNLAEHLTPFYRETHGNNMALARGQ